MASTDKFDAIVIGSGVSGGWAAKELTEKGLRVLMLDRGVMVEHGEDYNYDGMPAYEIPARNMMPAPLIKSDYFIAKYGYVSPSNMNSTTTTGSIPTPMTRATNFTGSAQARSGESR